MDALLGPGVEVAKCAGPPILRQISYCFHYKKNVENLRRRVRDLSNTRTELQARVDEAENNLESIKKCVLDWFETVDKETTRDETMLRLTDDEATFEMINQQFCKGLCCSRSRWKIGRDAQKKILIIEELLNQGKDLLGNNVSNPSPPVGTEFAPTNEDFEDFESRKSSKNQIMEALKDDKTNLVGVYGMGGIGKTMLINQVHKLVMEEKLFDVVAVTTVSENADLRYIQNEIGMQLGLKKLEETDNISTRAEMLRQRLMKPNQKFLVILDDLWTTELGLSDVGIPCRETRCKVVITTRSIDVCNSLGSHKNVEVGVLTEEESWFLFKKNVGEDVANSPGLQKVSRDIANECGKLPIALVTIGRALKNKDKMVWVDTADQLKNYDFSSMGEINSKVFKSIKLSYDHLGNEILKKIFLICSMFPEDYRISIVELMMHVMGDDEILKNVAGSTLEKVRKRLHNMLDKLTASCLLFGHKEDDGRISKVWMHDIVRYVALQIASQEGSGFFAEVGVGIKEWPESWRLLSRSTNTSKCLRVSLMRNEISVLPNQPEVPNHLLCLSLEGNRSLKKIPDSFFQKVESLATLNLSGTGISSLPSSLSCLKNLRSLDLGYCDLHEIDLSVIENLKKLEMLNLSNCKLFSLPEEIGGLSNLKLLDLSENQQLNFIPPNVISRLSRLEELYMFSSFKQWKVEQTGDGTSASLDEVTSLINSLKSVQLEVYNDEIKARISTGRLFRKWDPRYLLGFDHTFGSYLTASFPICRSIRELLAKVDDLKLLNCTGLKSVGQLFMGDNTILEKMKILAVQSCNEIEHLMSAVEEKIPTTTFIALETLYLCELDNLKEIFHGPMPTGFLDKLEQVYVTNCENLVSIFSPNFEWVKLKNLQGLSVVDCKKLKEVFYLKEEEKEEGCRLNKQDGHVDVTFPELKQLYLKKLSELSTIWKGVIPIESLQYLKVMEVTECKELRYLFSAPAMVLALQQLEELTIWNCVGMTGIVAPPEEMVLKDQVLIPPHTSNDFPPQIFPNLRKLVIRWCDNLKDLYPLTKLSHGGLSQLRRLEVENCFNLEEILLINTDVKVMLPQLESLSLRNLPSLIWNIPIGSFQNLRDVTISNCSDSLKHLISPVSLVLGGGLSQLEILEIMNCKGLKAIIDNHISPTVDDDDHQQNWSILLPQLKKMYLSNLHNLMTIAFRRYHNLKELKVVRCNRLKHILPIRLLPNLKEIRVEMCNEMEVIFNEDGGDHDHSKMVAFPHLKELHLFSLPKLSKFHQGPPILDWPSLQRLEVRKCENLKRLPFNHHHSLPALEEIIGDNERWFDEELEWEDQSLKSRLRPLFVVNIEDLRGIRKKLLEIEDGLMKSWNGKMKVSSHT